MYHLVYLIFHLDLFSCFNVLMLIILLHSTFLYTCLAWSSVRYLISLFLCLSNLICPPMFVFRGKIVVGSFLPFISLNVIAVVLYLLKNLLCQVYHMCL